MITNTCAIVIEELLSMFDATCLNATFWSGKANDDHDEVCASHSLDVPEGERQFQHWRHAAVVEHGSPYRASDV